MTGLSGCRIQEATVRLDGVDSRGNDQVSFEISARNEKKSGMTTFFRGGKSGVPRQKRDLIQLLYEVVWLEAACVNRTE